MPATEVKALWSRGCVIKTGSVFFYPPSVVPAFITTGMLWNVLILLACCHGYTVNGGFEWALLKWQIAVGIHSPTPEGNALLLSYSGKYWFNQRCLRMVKTECCWWIVKWYTGTLPFQILPLIPQYWTRLQWEAMHAGSVNTNQLLRYENTWRRKALGLNGRLYKIIGWMRSCEETTDSLWQVGIIFVFDNPGRLIWWLTLIRMDSI